MDDARSHSPTAPATTNESVEQLQAIVIGLGLGLIVVMLTFAGYVWKQNRNLSAVTNTRLQQIAQIRQVESQFVPILNELAAYARTKPELQAIFKRHGIDIKDAAPGSP